MPHFDFKRFVRIGISTVAVMVALIITHYFYPQPFNTLKQITHCPPSSYHFSGEDNFELKSVKGVYLEVYATGFASMVLECHGREQACAYIKRSSQENDKENLKKTLIRQYQAYPEALKPQSVALTLLDSVNMFVLPFIERHKFSCRTPQISPEQLEQKISRVQTKGRVSDDDPNILFITMTINFDYMKVPDVLPTTAAVTLQFFRNGSGRMKRHSRTVKVMPIPLNLGEDAIKQRITHLLSKNLPSAGPIVVID